MHHDALSAEVFDLKTDLLQICTMLLQRLLFTDAKVQRDRKEQPLRWQGTTFEQPHEPLIQHALVRAVLIDDDDAFVLLVDEIRPPELCYIDVERFRYRRRLRRRRRIGK